MSHQPEKPYSPRPMDPAYPPVRPCIDLHFHSVYSVDAFGVPSEYVRLASANGITAVAPAEHDNLDSLPKYKAAIQKQAAPLTLYSGVEIDVASKWGPMHILAYLFDIENRALNDILEKEVRGGWKALLAVVEAMNADGWRIDVAAVSEHARKKVTDRAIGSKALWLWLSETESCKAGQSRLTYAEAKKVYGQYARELPPAHTSTPIKDVIQVIHDAGGIAVLAHPNKTFSEEDVTEMIGMGVAAVEVYTPSNGNSVGRWEEVCKRRGWPMSGGSDYHGDTDDSFEAWPTSVPADLLDALFAAYEKRQGRRAEALCDGVG